MHARRWSTPLVLALACGRSEPEPAPSPSVSTLPATAAPRDEACNPERAAETEALLLRGCTPPTRADVRRLALARWEAKHTIDAGQDGVFVEVRATGVTLGGELVEPEVLAPSIAASIESVRDVRPQAGFELAIDGDAKLADVQSVVAALVAAKASHGALLFGSATLPRTARPAYPEIHARLAAELDAQPPAERAVSLARGLERVVQPCAPLVALFGSVAADEPSGRCERMMKGTAQALLECGCPSWSPEVISYMQVLGGPADAPQLHVDAIELDPTRPTAAARDLKWSSFIADRREPLGKLWLELGD